MFENLPELIKESLDSNHISKMLWQYSYGIYEQEKERNNILKPTRDKDRYHFTLVIIDRFVPAFWEICIQVKKQ